MLVLPSEIRREIEGWIRAGYPEETCGLFVGRVHGGRTEATRATHARNLNRERARDRYELDPADFMAADLAAREAGLEIVGVWHSHTHTDAYPSTTDVRQAVDPTWAYVIVSLKHGEPVLRAYRIRDGAIAEMPVVVEDH